MLFGKIMQVLSIHSGFARGCANIAVMALQEP
jgi:hypothetical protein